MSKPADGANTGNGKLSIEFLLHYPLEMKKLRNKLKKKL